LNLLINGLWHQTARYELPASLTRAGGSLLSTFGEDYRFSAAVEYSRSVFTCLVLTSSVVVFPVGSAPRLCAGTAAAKINESSSAVRIFTLFLLLPLPAYSLVVVFPVGSVDVAMLLFFFRSRTEFGDLHIKLKVLAGERMIAVQMNVVAFNLRYHKYWILRLGPRLELGAYFEFSFRELITRDGQLQLIIDEPVSLCRFEAYRFCVANVHLEELFFQGRKDLLHSFQHRKGFLVFRGIEKLSLTVF